MTAKVFDITGKAFVAVRLQPNSIEERKLLGSECGNVQLTRLADGVTWRRSYLWDDEPTRQAHAHIARHFDELISGAAIL